MGQNHLQNIAEVARYVDPSAGRRLTKLSLAFALEYVIDIYLTLVGWRSPKRSPKSIHRRRTWASSLNLSSQDVPLMSTLSPLHSSANC